MLSLKENSEALGNFSEQLDIEAVVYGKTLVVALCTIKPQSRA